MQENNLKDSFQLGHIFFKKNQLKDALKAFKKAIKEYEAINPSRIPARLLSYYGLCLSLVEGKVKEGVRICKKAIELEFYHPEFYLNLGKVYTKAGNKAKAIEVFTEGLKIDGDNREILQELRKLGIRKRPPLEFLPRKHFLNKYIGIITRKSQ